MDFAVLKESTIILQYAQLHRYSVHMKIDVKARPQDPQRLGLTGVNVYLSQNTLDYCKFLNYWQRLYWDILCRVLFSFVIYTMSFFVHILRIFVHCWLSTLRAAKISIFSTSCMKLTRTHTDEYTDIFDTENTAIKRLWVCHIVMIIPYFDGILTKGAYPSCLRMAVSALLAGYPRFITHLNVLDDGYMYTIYARFSFWIPNIYIYIYIYVGKY